MADRRGAARWPRDLYRLGYNAAFFLASLAVGWTIADRPGVNPLVAFYLAIACVWCANFILIAAHEFGHAAATAMVGWRVAMIVIGPAAVKLHPFRIHFGTPMRGSYFSGAVWPVPLSSNGLRLKWIIVFAGGPIANLTVACVGCLLANVLPISNAARITILALSALSAAKGLLNFIPFDATLGGRSDGGAILDLLRGADPALRGTIMRAYDQIVAGVRARDWPEQLVAELSASFERSQDGYEAFFLYAHHLDKEDFATARSLIDQVMQKNGPIDSLLLERAFFSAFCEHDYASAEQLLACVKLRHSRRSPRYFEVHAMLAFSKGDLQEGDRQIWLARRALKNHALTTNEDWETVQKIADRFVNIPPEAAVRAA